MKEATNIVFIFTYLLAILILFCGCIGESSLSVPRNDVSLTNPETGITNWMDAMNKHDASRLYDLSPDMIKKQISKPDFLKVNEQNGMFIDNISFVDYSVLNETQNDKRAMIKAQLVMATPHPVSGNVTYSGIFYTFDEYYEKNEWKVWATGLEP